MLALLYGCFLQNTAEGCERHGVAQAELMPLSSARMSEEVVSVKLPEPIGSQELPLELRRSILATSLRLGT